MTCFDASRIELTALILWEWFEYRQPARRAPPNRTATPQSLQGHTSVAEPRVAERSGDATPTSTLYVHDYDASPSWRKPRSRSQFWSSDPRSRTGEQSPSLLPVADSMSIPSPGITGPKTAPAGYPKRAFPNESTNPPRRAILMSQRGPLQSRRPTWFHSPTTLIGGHPDVYGTTGDKKLFGNVGVRGLAVLN